MISDEQIKQGYLKQFGREIADADLQSFRWFMRELDCEDSTSYEEAFERIDASISSRCE